MKQSEWDSHGKKFWDDIKPLHKIIRRVHLGWAGFLAFILFSIYFLIAFPDVIPQSWKKSQIERGRKDALNTHFYGRFVGTKPAGHGSTYYLFLHGMFRDKIPADNYLNYKFFNELTLGDSAVTFKGDSIITVFKNGEKIVYPKLNLKVSE